MKNRAWIAYALLSLAACGGKREQPGTGSGSGRGSDADTSPVAKPAWPAAPAPSLPAALAAIRWPSSAEELAARWPALGDPSGGMRGDGLLVRVEGGPPPISAHLWISRPGLDLRVLEDAWGPNTRDPSDFATWFAVDARLKARYPARSGNEEGVELSFFLPALDRIENAPDGMVPGAGPLLGQKVEALASYRAWTAMQSDTTIQLHLPPGEWDYSSLKVLASLQDGTVRRVLVTVRVGRAPVDKAAILERLRRRWGHPKKTDGITVYESPDGVRVEVQEIEGARLEITYQRK